jgi:hypothetical protein
LFFNLLNAKVQFADADCSFNQVLELEQRGVVEFHQTFEGGKICLSKTVEVVVVLVFDHIV